jgi:hypothetical protein
LFFLGYYYQTSELRKRAGAPNHKPFHRHPYWRRVDAVFYSAYSYFLFAAAQHSGTIDWESAISPYWESAISPSTGYLWFIYQRPSSKTQFSVTSVVWI